MRDVYFMYLQKIVIAPDSFKESMTAQQVGNIIKQAFTNASMGIPFIMISSGWLMVVKANCFNTQQVPSYTVIVNDPLMRPIEAWCYTRRRTTNCNY